MKHYTMKKRGSRWGGLDVFKCKYCPHETHLEYRIEAHLRAFHPEKLEEVIESLSDMKHSELVAMAKKQELPYYGTKQEIIERLENSAQDAESHDEQVSL